MAWSWMEGASGWIIPSPNVHTHPHQASTWVDPHSEYFAGQKTHSDKYAELVWVVCINFKCDSFSNGGGSSSSSGGGGGGGGGGGRRRDSYYDRGYDRYDRYDEYDYRYR